MANKKYEKSSEKYYCKFCNYGTSRQSQYERHLITPKHKRLTNANEKVPKSSLPFSCECGKTYKHKSSLCKHIKTCKFIKKEKNSEKEENNNFIEDETFKELFEEMVNQNKALHKTMAEQRKQINELIPKIGSNNNNRYNLNIFLNESCKDAINIMDFVTTLNVTEIENNNNIDYVSGITKLIVDELKNMDIHKRPLHCSDTHNEIIYVKDNNVWEKDDKEKQIVLKAIEHVDKNILEAANNNNCESIISNISKSSSKDKEDVISNIAKQVTL